MSCKEFVELVTDYFDEALDPATRKRFEEHLEVCPWCGRYVEQMRLTVRTVGRIDEEALAPDARERLLDAFRDWKAAS